MPSSGLTHVDTAYSRQGDKETPLQGGWQSLPVLPCLIRMPSTALQLPGWGETLG